MSRFDDNGERSYNIDKRTEKVTGRVSKRRGRVGLTSKFLQLLLLLDLNLLPPNTHLILVT